MTQIYTIGGIFIVHEKYGDMIEKWKEDYTFVNCTFASNTIRTNGYTHKYPTRIATDHIVAMIDLDA